MESQPQILEFRNIPETFHPCIKHNVMDQDVSFSLVVSFPCSNIYRDIFVCLFVCLFVLILYIPVNNFSVMMGRVFLG